MAKITGFVQKIFGKDATNIGQVGSAAAGTKVLTNDPATIQALTAFTNGVNDVTLTSKRIIPQEEFMALHYLHTLQNAYAQQEGIQEYNSGVTYYQYSVVKKAGTYQIYGSKTDNNIGNALTDTSKWQLLLDLSSVGTSSAITGGMRNAKMSVTTASASATFTADEIIVSDTLSYKLSSYSKTINLATTGAGGMDTGTAPVSGYVALYAIYNPSTDTSSILAKDATSTVATETYSGANMPSGYTASALIGVWPTTAASLFIVGYQFDRSIYFSEIVLLNTTTQNTTYTSLDISGAVPKNAKTIYGHTICKGSTISSKNDVNISGTPSSICDFSFAISYSVYGVDYQPIRIVTPQTIYYKDTTTSASLDQFVISAKSYTF